MKNKFAQLRQLSQMDIRALLEYVKRITISQKQVLDLVEWIYKIALVVALGCMTVAMVGWLFPPKFSVTSKKQVHEDYGFAQESKARLRILSAFDAGGAEGKDPLWLELRGFLDFVGVNARPDNASGCVAIFRWLSTGSELRGCVGQTIYFASSQSQWTRVDKSHPFSLAIKLLQGQLIDGTMQLQLEVLHPKEGDGLEIIETITLVRDIAKKSADVTGLQAIVRGGCKWWGPDLFLMNHAGESKDLGCMQRLEIGPTNKAQIFYLGPGYGLIQKGQEFIRCPLGTQTQGHTLWVVEDVNPDKLKIVAWSVSGDQKQEINISKTIESWQPQPLQSQIQLAGVRSKDQLLVQIQQERWNLKNFDWLLHTAQGWEKIRTAEQVDAYVLGELKGELLVLSGLQQESAGAWKAFFRLYSPCRSLVEEFELHTNSLNNAASTPPSLDGPTPEQLKDPSSLFVPMRHREEETVKWPEGETRARLPPSDISPEKMLDILRGLSEPDGSNIIEPKQATTPPVSGANSTQTSKSAQPKAEKK